MGFFKKAGGVALCAAMGLGICAGTLSTGTGALVGYYAKKDVDALCAEFEQTEEYEQKKSAEDARLEALFENLEESRQAYADGEITKKQLAEQEDAFKVDYTYSQNNFTRQCIEESNDPYFQSKLSDCVRVERVAQGFFWTGIGIYGIKFFLTGLACSLDLHHQWGDDPVCTTSWLRGGIEMVWEEMVLD